MIDSQITGIQNAQISTRWLTVSGPKGQMPSIIPGVEMQRIGCSPPPRLIMQSVLHLEKCKGVGLLLIPQWKSAVFYPLLMEYAQTKCLKNRWIFAGKNVFSKGIDNTSCFGPEFTGKVELWYLDFNT